MAPAAGGRKLQRWVDLLAALLRRHYPISFEELVAEVPEYERAPSKAALRRSFERDKDELRTFGIPIEAVSGDAGEVVGYRLRREQFYLPYLSVAAAGVRTPSRRVDREGYRALPQVVFEPDELLAIAQAIRRMEMLGEPGLAARARSAGRKLAVDLPLMDHDPADTEALARARGGVAPAVFQALDQALAGRKRAEIDYLSLASGERAVRTVEPFGLFFLGQHWYLAARSPGETLVKNYRVSRIVAATPNPKAPRSPDYQIPAEFRLRDHARSRHAWELGEGDDTEVVVEFTGAGGVAAAAARLGEPVDGSETRRSFRVRRPDAFVRWLLSLGGAAHPRAPEAIVQLYRDQLALVAALYGDAP